MKQSKELDNYKEIENHKEFSQNLTTGKNLLLDYNNNEIECTIYGQKKPKYSLNVTGLSSYQDRLKKNLIQKVKYNNTPQYIPISNRLLGSSMYPRPLSIPFYNEENEKNKGKYLLDLIKQKELYNNNNLNIKKNNNEIPNFFCVKLALNSPKNKKRLINIFKQEIDLRKKKYRYQPKYYKKDIIFRGLTQQKITMENNLTKYILNGGKIPITTQNDINTKYKIINTLISNKNNKEKENEDINKEEYNKLYRIKKIQEMTKNNINNNIKSLNNLKSLSAPRNIFNNKRNIKSRQKIINNLDYSTSIINNNSQNQNQNTNTFNKSIKFNSTITTCYNYNIENKESNINNESKLIMTKNELYSPKTVYKLKRALSDFQSSVFNLEIINDNNNQKEKKIKKKKEIEDNCEHENELIKGYHPSLIDIDNNFDENKKKMKQPEYISPGIIYKKECEMFIKVNPIEYEKQERKRIFDDKILKKKMLNKKIYERIKFKK